MSVYVHSDFSEAFAEFDRLEGLPTNPKTQKSLDAVLTAGFTLAQSLVHVDTESLKKSGKKSSTSGNKVYKYQWVGTLRWGGPSLGVNNPVDYAIYEKARDGAHDWVKPIVPVLHPLFVLALKKEMSK